jgi:WD40 repeat protein
MFWGNPILFCRVFILFCFNVFVVKIGEEFVLKQVINAHVDSWVTSLTFLPNGDLVSGLFKEIRIFTNNNNFNNDYTLKQIIMAHSNNVVSLISLEATIDEFASSETSIAQSSIRIWKRNKLNTLAPYFSLKNEIKLVDKLDSPLVQLPNGNLAAASFNTILIWDIVESNGTLLHELNAKEAVSGFIRVISAWKRGDKHVYLTSGTYFLVEHI